jgi:hypothetical protein
VIQEVANTHLRRIVGGVLPRPQFGDIVRRRCVESKQAVVAQFEYCERGKCLGHRCDAKHRVARDRAPGVEILHAEGADVYELPVSYHTVDEAGCVRIEVEVLEDAVGRTVWM